MRQTPLQQDLKTKKTRNQDSKTKKPRHQDPRTKTPRHRQIKKTKRVHRDPKTFFQRTKNYNIEIPRLKNHDIEKFQDIEFLRNSNHNAPWCFSNVMVSCFVCFSLAYLAFASNDQLLREFWLVHTWFFYLLVTNFLKLAWKMYAK